MSANRSQPWKAPASRCAVRSVSATRPISIRSCCSTISATTTPTRTSPGFPWHPHRGIETITYVLAGTVEHGDSLGNRGQMGAGDVQWMTAGQRHPAPGDAEGRPAGAHARLPAVVEPAVIAEDDQAAVSGHLVGGHSRSDRRRRHARARSSSAISGARRDRWKASRPIRATSMCRCRREKRRRSRSIARTTRLPTCSRDRDVP